MKSNAIFTVKKREDHTEEEDENAEIQGKIYNQLEDEELNNANRHVIELVDEAGYEDAFFLQILD